MGVKINKIRGRMTELGISMQDLAEKIGVDRATLYRWFDNPDLITMKTVNKLIDILNFNSKETMDIFFDMEVA